MSMAATYDIGHYIKAMPGLPNTSVPSSSGAAFNGITIDRLALGRRYQSCRSAIQGRLTASTAQAAQVTPTFQHSSDGTSWDNFSTATNPALTGIGSTASTGASQSTDGVAEQAVDLRGARRYVRQVGTVAFTLTTSGDSLAVSGMVIFGGADELPSL